MCCSGNTKQKLCFLLFKFYFQSGASTSLRGRLHFCSCALTRVLIALSPAGEHDVRHGASSGCSTLQKFGFRPVMHLFPSVWCFRCHIASCQRGRCINNNVVHLAQLVNFKLGKPEKCTVKWLVNRRFSNKNTLVVARYLLHFASGRCGAISVLARWGSRGSKDLIAGRRMIHREEWPCNKAWIIKEITGKMQNLSRQISELIFKLRC